MSLSERLRQFARTATWRKEQAGLWAARHFHESERAAAAKLADIVVAYTSLRFDQIEPSSRFVEDLRMVDLQDVEVIMRVEKEFCLSIPAEDVEGLNSISALVRYLAEKRA